MRRHATTTLTYRPRTIPMAFLAAALGGLSFANQVHAAPIATAAELQQGRVLLAMMDEMGKAGGMGGMPSGQPGAQMGGATGGTSSTNSGGMGGMDSMCCMGAMGKAPGAGTTMAMPSALPGFPGASHLYHVGASGFFLDHADKIGLNGRTDDGVERHQAARVGRAIRRAAENGRGRASALAAHCGRPA